MSLGLRWKTANMELGYHLADANDFGPTGLNLTNTGSVTFPAVGYAGSAFFTGTTNKLSTATTTNVDIYAAWSISYWVKYATVANNTVYGVYRIATTGGVADRYSRCTMRNTGGTYSWRVNPSNNSADLTYTFGTAPTFALNTWYHNVITHEGASTANINMYLNGELVATTAMSTSTSTDAISLGTNDIETEMEGWLDEFVMYSGVLSAGDVRRLYAEGKGKLV